MPNTRIYDCLRRIGFALLLCGTASLGGQQTSQRGLEHPPTVEKTSPTDLAGKTYALLIGVSRYKNDPPITSLQYADRDAETFAELLKTPIGGSLREPDEIRLLTNEKATRAAIDDAVRDLRNAHGGPQNTLILFVGAHGVYLTEEEDPVTHRKIQKDPYILLYDTNTDDAKTTGYPMAEFRRMVAEQALSFGRVLVFLDVCHAANVAGIAGGGELQDAVKRAWQGQAGQLGLMMASHAGESAIESSAFGGGHGAFSYFLMSGLDGQAAEGDTAITFADLAEYVRTNVRRATRKAQDPYDQAPNTDIVLIPDIRKEGLSLPEARPLSEQELRDLRRRRGTSAPPALPATGSTVANDVFQGAALSHTALADKGQEIMSRYLEGDEIPQIEADFRRCQRYFEEALALPEGTEFDRSRALFCQGRAEIFTGRYDDAQRLLEESIRIDSRRAYSYNALGIAYLELVAKTGAGFDQAEAAFRNAMRYAPYWAYPVHNLALLNSERGDYDSAIQLYRYAMTIGPRYSYLPYNLGLLYERLGDFENAQIWFEKAREVLETYRKPSGQFWPERGRIWNALGTIDVDRGRDGSALELFREAMADDPADPNARHNAALLLAKKGDFKAADDLWIANINQSPSFMPSRISYAESLAARGETAAAIRQYESIVGDKPAFTGAREALARMYVANRQPERALDQVNTALAQSGPSTRLLELRGDVEAQLGRSAAAISDWRKAGDMATDRASKGRLKRKLRDLRER